MIDLGNGTGVDIVTGVIMGVLYGVPAYIGACGVRWFLCRRQQR